MKKIILLGVFSVFFNLSFSQEFDEIAFVEKDEPMAVWNNLKYEKLESKNLRILPSGKFLRVLVDNANNFTKVIIQDMSGSDLLENSYDLNRDLDISTLKSGSYIIKVIMNDKILMGKFFKKRS